MSTSNGQIASAEVFNAAYVSKTTDSTTVGSLTVNKPADGAAVNVQVDVNQLKADVLALETDQVTPAEMSDAIATHAADKVAHIVSDTTANLEGLARTSGAIYYSTDEMQYYGDDGADLIPIGSGEGGSGGINFITNSSAEDGAAGWATYLDAAGTAPVNGVNGTAVSTTFTVSTSQPLSGAQSFLLTKLAANAQGEGVGYDFGTDRSTRYKILKISFDYEIASGTYADNDLSVWIYDVLNGALIPCVGHQIKNAGLNSTHQATFQCTDSESYRLIIHVSSTSALAYSVKLDNVSVGPQSVARGPMISDWTSLTSAQLAAGTWLKATTTDPTYGTVSANAGRWRRIGSNMELEWHIRTTAAGTAGSGQYEVDVSGLGVSIDTSGIVVGSTTAKTTDWNTATSFDWFGTSVGTAYGSMNNGTNFLPVTGQAFVKSATRLKFHLATNFTDNTNRSYVWNQSYGFGMAAIHFTMRVSIPVLGWGTSQVLSSSEDGRVCSFSAYKNGGSAFTGDVAIPSWTGIHKDSHGGFNATTGLYTVQVPGDYVVNWAFRQTAAGAGAAAVIVNGSAVRYGPSNTSTDSKAFSALIPNLKAGDTIAVGSSGSATLSSSNSLNVWSLFRLSGNQQIAASEKIVARYSTAAGQSIATGTGTIIDFGTRASDSHGSVTTGASWKFSAPTAGTYKVHANVTFAAYSYSGTMAVYIYKNGVENSTALLYTSAVAFGWNTQISGEIEMLAGDYIDIRVFQNSGVSRALQANGAQNFVTISKVGN